MSQRRYLLIAFTGALLGCHRTVIEYPAVPPVSVKPTPPPAGVDYTQKLVGTENVLKKRLAVARFNDNQPIAESPFGHKEQVDVVGPGLHVHHEEIAPETSNASEQFTEKLIEGLSATNRFILIERKDINSLMREISFGQTKWVDKNKSAKVGKILGAQIVVTGSVGANQDPSTRGANPKALFLRMYDIETSRIVGSAKAFGRTEDEVIDRAVAEIVGRMDRIPWTGKIASIAGEKAYMNAGMSENIKRGDIFRVFALGSPVKDPDTGETIGYEEEPAGKAEVVEVSERMATLKLNDKTRSIKVGDKVQPETE